MLHIFRTITFGGANDFLCIIRRGKMAANQRTKLKMKFKIETIIQTMECRMSKISFTFHCDCNANLREKYLCRSNREMGAGNRCHWMRKCHCKYVQRVIGYFLELNWIFIWWTNAEYPRLPFIQFKMSRKMNHDNAPANYLLTIVGGIVMCAFNMHFIPKDPKAPLCGVQN